MRFTFVDSDTGMFKSVMDPALTKPGHEAATAPVIDVKRPEEPVVTAPEAPVVMPPPTREYLLGD